MVGLKADGIQAIMNDDEYVLMLRSADLKDGLSVTLIFLKTEVSLSPLKQAKIDSFSAAPACIFWSSWSLNMRR